MALTPGTRLGVYEITTLLGEGGMGQVYRATDTKLKRQVAIKILPPSVAADHDRLARFQREAEVLASLNHPNIAAIYGLEYGERPRPHRAEDEEIRGEVSASVRAGGGAPAPLEERGQFPFLVMELVEGEDLSTLISRGSPEADSASSRLRDSVSAAERESGPSGHPDGKRASASRREGEVRRARGGGAPRGLNIEDTVHIAKQIADALEAAHEQGIIHRDLKPANIKVRADGTVKVLDFGLAKAMEPAGASSASASALANSPTLTSPAMTQMGMILGTAAYMSPEQARGRAVDKRADIWAFGCVLFEMLTGQRAFPGEDITDTLAAVVRAEPDWSLVPTDLSPTLLVFLKRCLQKDPKQRIGDIHDVRLALDGAFETVDPQTANAVPAVPRRHVREYFAWGLATVATLVAIGAALLYLRAPRQADTLVRFSVAPPADVVRPSYAGFAVTPDGQTIGFVARGADGVPRIFVRRLDAADAQVIAGTDRAQAPFWAPDGRSLAFVKEGGLYRVALDGSAPRLLCSVPATAFGGGTWSARGLIVFASRVGGLLQVPDTGGTPTPVTTLDAAAKEVLHLWPWFLPDGRHLLFLALADGQTRGTIWATAIDNPARTRIVESSGGAAYAAGWLLSTTATPRSLLAQAFDPERLTLQGTPKPIRDQLSGANTGGNPGFAVSSSGVLVVDRPPPTVSQLVWMDRTGRELARVTAPASLNEFALAPDERRVVAAIRSSDTGTRTLWLFDGLRLEGTHLTYDGGASRPIWALDGRHIYFTYFTGSTFVLSVLAIGAPAPTAFEQPGPFVHFEDVTRDGRYLVFKSLKSPSEIWIQRVGSAERQALVQAPFAAAQPRVSPDGHWLAYALSLPSGPEVFAQPFDRPGDRIQVSVKNGIGPVWRDDGRELYYEGPEGLMAAPMTERDGALTSGTPQKLFAIRTQGQVVNQPHNVEVAAHGQKFLVNTIVGNSDNAPLEVTLDWMAGLKQ